MSHSNTCDLVGFRQGYNAPAVCSCGADKPARMAAGLPAGGVDDAPKHVEDSLHAVFTAHGIASRSDYSQTLIGDLIRWAADACRRASKRELTELRAQLAQVQADAMIAHRWFAAQFGEQMNGRDFAVKCDMADAQLMQAEADRIALQAVIDELEDDGRGGYD